MLIEKYSKKKLIEYIKSGGRYLLRFPHGFGDLLMYLPVHDFIIRKFPESIINLYVMSGQEQIWGDESDMNAPDYDVTFTVHFPMSEGSSLTKQHKCAIDELGLTLDDCQSMPEVGVMPPEPSPLVGLHFQGTALPHSVNCPEPVAKQIWQEVKDAGKIPFEVHYQHVFHNPINAKYGFIDNTARNAQPTLHSLIGLIQRCWAFIGVASGPFVAALSHMPYRTLYLEKSHPLETYTKLNVTNVNVDKYEKGFVKTWLDGLDTDPRWKEER